MIEAAYEHRHIDARYLNCDVAPEALGDAVRGARAMGWVGFNCSIPHKVSVIKYLDGLGNSAALIGAVNCVVRRDNRYIGENTDGQGFLTALRTIADPAGKAFVLFGAGGAARAIAVETALAGTASITIVNRDPTRGSELVALLNEKTQARAELVGWDRAYRIPEESDIVVNATSIGLFPHVEGRLDLDLDSLRPGLVVADVIPNPPRTQRKHAVASFSTALACWSARVQSVSGIGPELNLSSRLCAGSSSKSSALSTGDRRERCRRPQSHSPRRPTLLLLAPVG
jgi:shikimate dehydrogenase